MQRLLAVTLEANGFVVTVAANAQEGLAAAGHRRHDLILLELDLPGAGGGAVLKQLREWTQTPVVALTALDEEAAKIQALDGGADECIVKPFKSGEFLARLRAVLRRANKGRVVLPVFCAAGLTVDLGSRRVTRNGKPVKLTATEYALLQLFIQHADQVVTHRQILREIWGPEHEKRTEYLRVYMTRLREKLEARPAKPVYFLTEPGVGYRFAASRTL